MDNITLDGVENIDTSDIKEETKEPEEEHYRISKGKIVGWAFGLGALALGIANLVGGGKKES